MRSPSVVLAAQRAKAGGVVGLMRQLKWPLIADGGAIRFSGVGPVGPTGGFQVCPTTATLFPVPSRVKW